MTLAADGLSMRFGRRRLFDALSFAVARGEPLAVVGANGSGKSTLLRVLAGLLTPTAGRVDLVLDGARVSDADRPLRVGLVAPALHLYEPFSGHENLDFLARARRLVDRPARVVAALDAVGLAGRGDDPVATYSTGMRQRLRLAAARLHDPPVLLLDEPGATLDASGRALVAAAIADAGRIVVVATNDPAEAALCPRRVELLS